MASPVLRGGGIESDRDQRLSDYLVRCATAGAKRELPVGLFCRTQFGLQRRANQLHISPRPGLAKEGVSRSSRTLG
jgi:hypothetical protein